MKDIMIDLETLGKNSNSVILSIAAVQFDIETGQIGKQFRREIQIQSCLNAGLKIDADTLLWWLDQSEEARAVFQKTREGETLQKALIMFTAFLNSMKTPIDELSLWGNSARFDLGLLTDAYKAIGGEIPWNFFNELDVRTLVRFRPGIKEIEKAAAKAAGLVLHDPIVDCHVQINYCTRTFQTLNR
jgi:hypothetical protein